MLTPSASTKVIAAKEGIAAQMIGVHRRRDGRMLDKPVQIEDGILSVRFG